MDIACAGSKILFRFSQIPPKKKFMAPVFCYIYQNQEPFFFVYCIILLYLHILSIFILNFFAFFVDFISFFVFYYVFSKTKVGSTRITKCLDQLRCA